MDRTELLKAAPTPSYVIDISLLKQNLSILRELEQSTGCHVLLAQKAFSMYSLYPLISEYISGTTASGLYEARLGSEEFRKENHIFSPAYNENEFEEIIKISDHIVFNSFSQVKKFRPFLEKSNKKVSCGIRINPELSTQEHAIYDPCSPFSRLGVTRDNFEPEQLEGIEGFHFHTLCEQNSDALEATLDAVETKFGEFLPRLKWINFGGGHHITRKDYDVEKLKKCIKRMRDKYGLEVFIEPGEAVVLNTGFLVSTVLEKLHNGMDILILDTSAACHMPDVLEMPYRPSIIGAGEAGEKPHTYRLGSATCLAGDIIGDYSFDREINVGDKLIFCDMALYTMVKNNTFNGMALPSICTLDEDGKIQIIKQFGYDDFKSRL